VHARAAEDAFVAKGHGLERKDVWWNRFLLVGPPAADARDESALWALTVGEGMERARPVIGSEERGDRSVAAPSPRLRGVLRFLAAHGWLFVSRGDRSGTHQRELELWGTDRPSWPGYLETGQGMGPTLTIADEKGAYTLTDEGTYLRMRRGLRLEPVLAEDPALRNPYGAILVKPSGDSARAAAARRLYDWLTSDACRALVRGLAVDGGRAFFLPDEEATGALRGRLDGPPR
jgi:tungstate transport system substrate-binding protein